MKRKLIFLLLVSLVVLVLSISVSAADVQPTIELDNGVELTPIDNAFYLPSFVDVTRLKFNFASSYQSITYDGAPVSDGSVIDVSSHTATDKISGTMTYYKIRFGTEDTTAPYQTISIYKADNLPAVFINTSIGAESVFDNDITDPSAGVQLVDKNGIATIDSASSEVRVRGNTTDDNVKKPFQIKFPKSTDVMGMGKAKTWLLLANYLDQSYIRNSVMYKLAKDMGMGASDFKNVDVYLDGEYQGVYLLCEKVNINKNRVNIFELEDLNDALNSDYSSTTVVTSGALIDETVITEYKYVNNMVNPDDITGGYLIELDNNNKSSRSEFGSYFMTSTSFGENLYVIKSPEYCSKEQVEYIARLFAELEEAMASTDGKNSLGKHYTEYIDLESYAVAYIMAEYGRNYDAGSASIYFNKDMDRNGEVSKVVKGPLWDCDNTLGNIHRNDAENQESMWAKNRTPWNMLTRHSDFNALVTEKFEEAYNLIYDMLDYGGFVDEQVWDIGNSAHMDRLLWTTYDDSKWPLYENGDIHWFQYKDGAFPAYRYYNDEVNDTTDTAIGFLCVTMQARAEYLKDEWNCDVAQRTRILSTDAPPADEGGSNGDGSTETEAPIQSDSTTSNEGENTKPSVSEESSNTQTNVDTESENQDSQYESSQEPDEENDKNIFERIIQAIVDFFKSLFSGLFGTEE